MKKKQLPLAAFFSTLPDPRTQGHNKLLHNFEEIVLIAILATICGADTYTDIVQFAYEKKQFLLKHFELKNGIPSHNTFGRIFSILDPEAFSVCFRSWVASLQAQGKIVSLDGKSVRRSHTKDTRPLHLVNAFCTESGLVLGQRKVDGKTNEITAIPELLDLLELEDCVVTTDAMGCQGWIAQKIRYCKADYVLAVKGNQGKLQKEVTTMVETAPVLDTAETTETGHGRHEVRTCKTYPVPTSILETEKWVDARIVVVVTATRTINEKTSTETRYFLSSLPPDATRLLHVVRAHWGIENRLHWSLDISFGEDRSRVRLKHAGENLALVRKFALNLLRKDTSKKIGLEAKRRAAGWGEEYLLKIVNAGV